MAKEPGLFATAGMRSKVKATSSAVNAEPLWKRTPGRRRNSHTSSPTARHDSASDGTGRARSSVSTRLLNTMEAKALFGEMLW